MHYLVIFIYQTMNLQKFYIHIFNHRIAQNSRLFRAIQKKKLISSITAGWEDHKQGVSSSTNSQQSSYFKKWTYYANHVGIKDEWLQNLSINQQNLIISGFVNSIRQNHFGKVKSKKVLLAGSVEATISAVSMTFHQNSLRNPFLDQDGECSIIIARQSHGYKQQDPNTKNQQCLPVSSFIDIYNDNSTPLHTALGQLTAGALFFVMCSCEYTNVQSKEPRKTKILHLRNIRFFYKDSEMSNPDNFHQADFVSITFEFQKNLQKNKTISQHKTNTDFCPVKVWDSIKQRILSYPKTSESSKVNLFLKNLKLVKITSAQIQSHLKAHVLNIDPLQQKYQISRIGTHTVRTSLAMILNDQGVATYIIQIIGRWRSVAFMKYIRSALPSFTKGISQLMVNSEDPFIYHVVCTHDSSSQSSSGLSGNIDSQHQQSYKVFHIWK